MASRFSMACGFSSFATSGTLRPRAAMARLARKTSSAVRTKEMATASTACFKPNSRSFSSFSVSDGMLTFVPGKLMPWCSPRVPPFSTSHTTSAPWMACTTSSMRPSESSMRSPGFTSFARPR